MNNNQLDYYPPTKVVITPPVPLYSIKSNNLDFLVSEEHNLVINNKLVPAKDCVGSYKKSEFLYSGINTDQTGVKDSLNWLRLIVQIVCDATLVRSSPNKCRVQFKLSKERKIQRLKSLLDELKIPYTFKLCKKTCTNKLQPYYIRIYGQHARDVFKYLNDNKQFPQAWVNLNKIQIETVLEEIRITDGDSTKRSMVEWHSTNLSDVELIQKACTLNGIICFFKSLTNASGFKNGKTQYEVIAKLNEYVSKNREVKITKTTLVEPTVGVTVRHGTIITRRNGTVWVTGNCSPGKLETVINTVNQMKGTNHRLLGWYYRLNIVEKSDVKDKKDFKKLVILCHFPIESWDSMGRGSLLLYGHMHSMTIDHHSGQQMRTIPNRLDCGIDNAYKLYGEHRAFSWKEIKQFMNKSGFVYKEEQAR